MVDVKIKNLDRVMAFMQEVPRGVKATAMREIATYIIGDSTHGLKHDPAYKHIKRKEAYPRAFAKIKVGKKNPRIIKIPGYFSAAQFWWVIHNVKSLGRKRSPTGYSDSWQMKNDAHWDRVQITGQTPFDRFPARINKMVGWRNYTDVIKTNMNGAFQQALRAVNKWISERTGK